MTRLLPVLALLVAALWAPAPRAAGPADPAADAAIEAVIADQLAAFGRNDLAAAFAHASDGIRAKFGTAENFGTMVRAGYPMIWRPARWEWRGLAPLGDGRWVKTVLFEDGAGGLHEADYLMAPDGEGWRIHGVSLRRLPGATS